MPSAGSALAAAGQFANPANKAAELLFDQRPMSHRFMVRIDRSLYDLGSWSRVTGLSVRWAPITYRTGESSVEEIFPGTIKNDLVKLSRAACSDSVTVKKWLSQTTLNRRTYSGGISMLDFLGLPVMTWEFRELFPVAWSVSDFDSGSGKPVIETLELAHTGFLDDEATATAGVGR